MNLIKLGGCGPQVSDIGLGCMRLAAVDVKSAENLIKTAMEAGVTFFDHADIYGGGKSEKLFAEAVDMKPSIREKMTIQSKCSIRRGWYDCSKEYILESVDGILDRLRTDYLDILLLHRPDALTEPEEVAEAFQTLEQCGKVRHFGVSNHNPMQIELLSRSLKQKLIVNQMQLSITNSGMIDSGLNVNTESNLSIVRDGSVLDYCRLKDITIQAWSPFQYGVFQGTFLGNDKYPELNRKIDEIAEARGVTNSAVALAWILRHPAKIQTIVGTTNAKRLTDICKAPEVKLTRLEWYEIYRASGKTLP